MALQLDRYSFTHISVDAVQATELEDLGKGPLTEDDFEIELQAIPDKESEAVAFWVYETLFVLSVPASTIAIVVS